jgi:hypothetical protein
VTYAGEPERPRPAVEAGPSARRHTWLWLWGPVVLQMAVIFIASSIPNLGELPAGVSAPLGHTIGYALLGALLLRALAGGRVSGVTWGRALAAVLLATLYGVSDEAHQSFVPGRSPDRFDVLADCAGAALAVMLSVAAVRARRWGILKRFG